MEKREFLRVNRAVLEGLGDASEILYDIPYFVTGSVCLLSYTKGYYLRKMNDVDIVADVSYFRKIRAAFEKRGYKTEEFRDVGALPLRIAKHFSTNDYLRFSKRGCKIDIVGACFSPDKSLDVKFLPGIMLHVPPASVFRKRRSLAGAAFYTTPLESLLCLNEFYSRTAARIVHTKKETAGMEREFMRWVCNMKMVGRILEESYISIFGLRVSLHKIVGYSKTSEDVAPQ